MQNFPLDKKGSPLVTFSLFGFKGILSRCAAFFMMGIARLFFPFVPKLKFYKLVGSGDGIGFSLKPDFGRYGLIAVWKEHNAFDAFLKSHLYCIYKFISSEQYHLKLATLQSKGKWSGSDPFEVCKDNLLIEEQPIVVLTRASIRLSKVVDFWKHVPVVSKSLLKTKGLIASIGIGEAPLFKQATLSIWRNSDSIKNYAYKMEQHKEVIKKTRERNWYKEELFARFAVLDSFGSWKGRDPLRT